MAPVLGSPSAVTAYSLAESLMKLIFFAAKPAKSARMAKAFAMLVSTCIGGFIQLQRSDEFGLA
jgi:hypothetical protein